MPLYKIESTAQVRRIYIIEANSKDHAEELCQDAESAAEEDISEEIDSVEILPDPKQKEKDAQDIRDAGRGHLLRGEE